VKNISDMGKKVYGPMEWKTGPQPLNWKEYGKSFSISWDDFYSDTASFEAALSVNIYDAKRDVRSLHKRIEFLEWAISRLMRKKK